MKKHLLFFILIFLQLQLVAQENQITISGTVIGGQTNMPLPSANVIEKGTSNGTMTNFDGEFTITVSDQEAVVTVSFVGFTSQEFTVGNQTKFQIKLAEEPGQLDEVVLIGYQTVNRRDLTGSVSSIKSDDIEGIPVTNVASLIATQSTGVQSINLGGAPGARSNLVIRGNTSISGDLYGGNQYTAFSNPLYVVDGVQTSLEDLAGYNVSNTDFLASLNPNDVESIDILKDASAAAIYGSRGANGVIIIKTKQGKALEKTEFDFSTSIGFQPKPELVSMLVGTVERREKMRMITKWWRPDALMDDRVPVMLTDSLNPAFNNNVDYQGLFYQTGISQRYNLSMRGGGEKSNYRISLGYNDDKGVVKATGFDRYTLNSSINSKVGKRFNNQFRANVSFTSNHTGQGNPDQYNYDLNSTLPVDPASLNSSLFYLSDDTKKSLTGELDDKLNTDEQLSTTFTNIAQLEVLDGLVVNSQLTFQYDSNKKNFYEPSSIRQEGDGLASYSLYTRKNLASDLYLSYSKTFGDHNITAILGNRADYNKYEDMGLYAIGYGSDAIKVINSRYSTDEVNGYTDISANALLSYYGRFTYNYKERYILSGSFSVDGSSRFGKDVRWAKFPSLSAAWIFSEETFIEPYVSSWLDFAKLKFSWGINGKQFQENYLRFGAYSLGYGGQSYYNFNQMNVSSYGGTTGVIPNYDSIGNNKLSWEESEQWNLGFEIEMLKHRLNLTFDAYHKATDKLFFDITFPAYSGYNRAKSNVAGILNYGWESYISYQIFPRTNDLRLELSLGLSQNKNYVTQLPNGNQDYSGDVNSDYGYVVGLPINLYKMFSNDYIIDDLNQLPVNPYTGQPLIGKWSPIRPGLPIWKDLNGDYLLNENHDFQLIRNYSPVPDIQGNFNINLQYKNWYFQAYSQFSFGADIKNTVLNKYLDNYDRSGDEWATTGLADLSKYSFWEKLGDGAAGVRFPALYPAGGGLGPFYAFRNNQTLWLESGDYWQVTNASVGYIFKKDSFIENLDLTRLRLYISVLNPYQWQRSKTVVDASLVDAKGHVIGNGYPQARTFSFGLDAKF